jgi:hypothetical protein
VLAWKASQSIAVTGGGASGNRPELSPSNGFVTIRGKTRPMWIAEFGCHTQG